MKTRPPKEASMPIIKMLRGGQVTLPQELRKEAQLQEGDLIEVCVEQGKITLKPVVTLTPDEDRQRLRALLAKSRKSASNMSEEDIANLVDEEVKAVRAEQRQKEARI